MQVPSQAIEFIRKHSRFLVLGHKEPDGDCVASQLTFALFLEQLGKKALLVSAGPFDRPEIVPFKERFSAEVKASDREDYPAVVVLDCSTADRTGIPEDRVAGLPCMVIDHHSSGEAFGEVRFVVTSAPAATMLVLALSDSFGLTPSKEQARLILFGLCTDTGFFRHLGPGTSESFRTIARLVDLGTSTAEIFQMVYGKRDLGSRKLLAAMLGRTESFWDGRLLLTWQSAADRGKMEGYLRGEDELYRLLQTVKGNEVVVFIKEEAAGRYSVGLRSNHEVDVGAVAASFGGGGHRQAAGYDASGTLDSVRTRILDVFAVLIAKKP